MSTPDPYTAMQDAVDIVNSSLHPTNKVAATLFLGDRHLSRTNRWPAPIAKAFGMETDIGSSSGTVHAEVSCLLDAGFATEGASLCVTDPFCPNCAKNIAEAGIKTIYIDHKGFDKDFAARRGDQFKNMSLQICAQAGISIYEVRRKDHTITAIAEIPADYKPVNDSPVVIAALPAATLADFLDVVSDSRANLAGEPFAAALAVAADGKVFSLCARPHLTVGYSRRVASPAFYDPDGKYSYILEPINRLLMNAARLGLKIHGDYLYSSAPPSSRELVNMVGAGLVRLYIGDQRDEHTPADALQAVRQLTGAGIITVSSP